MNKNNTMSNNTGRVVTISAGLVALAAAVYFFLGPIGKPNQKTTREWVIKMKEDVIKKLESMEDITKGTYDAVVDAVGGAYEVMAGGKEEVAKLSAELKSHWKSISSKAILKRKKTTKKKL